MSKEEQKKEEQYLEILYQSLHMTIVYEANFLNNLRGSQRTLWAYRDEILDKINDKRRKLGLII
jgi:hypothetical protein